MSGNTTRPNITGIDDDLRDSGWENENKYLTILDFGIQGMLSSRVNADIAAHQLDKELHPLGSISQDSSRSDYIGNKLLSSDFTNIDDKRSTTFFPQEVIKLDVGNVITHGYCRKFGKIMEYDIVFKLATDDPADTRQLFEST